MVFKSTFFRLKIEIKGSLDRVGKERERDFKD